MTTALLALALLRSGEDTPRQALIELAASYAKLKSISLEIEHDFSSGLFPGKFTQELQFIKHKGFKLVAKVAKGAPRPEKAAPDYYSDGEYVTKVGDVVTTDPLNTNPNTSPGYEVSGGLILTWLLESPQKDFLANPPAFIKLDFKWGENTEWRKESVKEILMSMSSDVQPAAQNAKIYLSPDRKKLVGFEWTPAPGKTGYMHYKNQKDNPELNPKDFKAPGSN